jgi:hypothetical protein
MQLISTLNSGNLKILRKVSKFQAPTAEYFDSFSSNALFRTASPSQRQQILEVRRSWHRPKSDVKILVQNTLLYGIPKPRRCVRGDYLAILKSTLDSFRPDKKIVPLTNGAALSHPDFPKTTSPGLPYAFERGIKTKGDVIDKYGSSHVSRIWQLIGRGIPYQLPDCLAFSREIASPIEKNKIRPVWGYPLDVFAEEARWFYPLFAEMKKLCTERDLCYGIGMETALGGHEHLRNVFQSIPGCKVLNLDYSSFDTTVPAWLIRDVISFMSDWFDFSRVKDSEGLFWDVKDLHTARRWRAMWSYFINTKIRFPTGERVQKQDGVPSGSAFTNLIDTLVNAVVTRSGLYPQCGIPTRDFYYGDDGAIFLRDNQHIDLHQFAKHVHSTFGLVVHPDKLIYSDNPDNIHWLGYFSRPGGPARPGEFIIASTLFPDREVLTPLDAATRLLGQLYSTMDPFLAVWFYDAVSLILEESSHTKSDLEEHVSKLHTKAMKYLITLGLSVQDITLPPVYTDPFNGKRRIDKVLSRQTSRTHRGCNTNSLPTYAFVAECYSNKILRALSVKSFIFLDLSWNSHPDDYSRHFEYAIKSDQDDDETYYSS